jgi:hypothetical protein
VPWSFFVFSARVDHLADKDCGPCRGGADKDRAGAAGVNASPTIIVAWPPIWTRSSPPWRTWRAPTMTDLVEALRQAAQARHRPTLRRAKDALQVLVTSGVPVSFARLALAAKFSRSWLDRQDKLRAELERHRGPSPAPPGPRPRDQSANNRVPPTATPRLPRRDCPPTRREPCPQRPARPPPLHPTSGQCHPAVTLFGDMSTT